MNRYLKLVAVAVVTLALMGSGVTPAAQAADSAAVSVQCKDVEAVFARGSGQGLTEPEARTFRDNLTASIKGGTSFNFYELGTEAQQGFKYEAIVVGGADWHHGVGAKVSGGEGMKYGSSVNSGVSCSLTSLTGQRNVGTLCSSSAPTRKAHR